ASEAAERSADDIAKAATIATEPTRALLLIPRLHFRRGGRPGTRRYVPDLHPASRCALRVGDLDPALIVRHHLQSASIRESEQHRGVFGGSPVHGCARDE